MDLNFVTEYCVPVVLLACLIVGYCIKHIKWLDSIANEYIPTILVVLGAVLCCISNGTVNLVTIVSGMFSGLASTGMHQVFKQLIEKVKEVKV